MLQFLFLLLHQLHQVLQKSQLAVSAAKEMSASKIGAGAEKAAMSQSKLDNGTAQASANLHTPQAIQDLAGELSNCLRQCLSASGFATTLYPCLLRQTLSIRNSRQHLCNHSMF